MIGDDYNAAWIKQTRDAGRAEALRRHKAAESAPPESAPAESGQDNAPVPGGPERER